MPNGVLPIAVMMAAGALAGVIFFAPAKAVIFTSRMPQVTLGGEPLALDGDEASVLATTYAIARTYLSAPMRVSGLARDVEDSREGWGATVDSARLRDLVKQLRDEHSALRKHAGANVALPLPIDVNPSVVVARFLGFKEETDRLPVDAKYSLTQRKVTSDAPGIRLDVYRSAEAVDAALRSGRLEAAAVVEPTIAARTASALGEISVSDALGYFETKYAKDWSHEARTYNLRLAASKLDGTVILPGETFDFNEVVGPRTEAFGYKVATVISQGELVDGIGGGTCQIAGTLHGAAFFAGLEVLERRPHSRPSGYIKMGMDATVVYPTITLRLRNPFAFPVVLHETVEDGSVKAEVLGPPRTRDVTLIRKVNSSFPFPVKDVRDPKLAAGERALSQRGIPGFRVTRYRIVREGSFAIREKYLDVYPPTPEIWKVGTNREEDAPKGHDDEHAEYVVDEFLTLTQGPDVKTNYALRGGGMIESRIPGKFGSYGWTAREGYTHERPKNER